MPTVFDNFSANVVVDGSTVNLGLWDTAGNYITIHFRFLGFALRFFFFCFPPTSPPLLEVLISALLDRSGGLQ